MEVRPNASVNQAGEVTPASAPIAGAGAIVETGIIVQQPNLPAELVNTSLPDYMQGAEDTSLALMSEFVSPPRLTIVQSMSPQVVKDQYGEGAIYAHPSNALVIPKGGAPLRCVPLFFYNEFICWNPRGIKPQVRARSFDKTSEIAIRARSFDSAKMNVPCQEFPDGKGGFKPIKYMEHLNFVVMMLEGEFVGEPMIISFKSTGFKEGRNWCEQIKIRKCPSYGLIFNISASSRSNNEGSWFGFDIVGSVLENGLVEYVPQDWFDYGKHLNERFAADYLNGLLIADVSDQQPEESNSAAAQPNRF